MPQWALDLPAPQGGRGDEESKLKQTGESLRGGTKGAAGGTNTPTPPPAPVPAPAERSGDTIPPGLNDPQGRP